MGAAQRRSWGAGMRVALACGLFFLAAVTAPAGAQAAAIDVVLTQDQRVSPGTSTVAVRVTGSADAPGSVDVRQGSCGGAPSGPQLGSPVLVGAGSFDTTVSGTLSGQISLCAYLLDGMGDFVDSAFASGVPVVLTSPVLVPFRPELDPPRFVQGGTARLNFGYTTSVPRTTQIFVHGGAAPCGATSGDEQDTVTGVVLLRPATNGINGSYDVRLPETTSGRVCIYVGRMGDTADDPPVLHLSASYSNAREPVVGAISLTPTFAPGIDDLAQDVVVRGSSEVPRPLVVTAQRTSGSCAPDAQQALARPGASNLSKDVVVGEDGGGAYEYPVRFTPDSSGRWLLCAYVGPLGEAPEAQQTRVLEVVEPTGQLNATLVRDGGVRATSLVDLAGAVQSRRRLFAFAGADRTCPASAYDAALQPGVTSLTSAEGDLVGPGTFHRRTSVFAASAQAIRVCAYVAELFDDPPVAVAQLAFVPGGTGTPPGGTPPGGTPPGGTPPGGGGDPVPVPPDIGKQGRGSFWVNNTVLPAGMSVARFVEIARSSGERWGYTFRGVTTKGAAKRDGRRIIGFSSVVSTSRVGAIVTFRKRAKRPKGCGQRRTGRCRVRYVVVERDIALARRHTGLWEGPGHPPADRYDVESVLLRLFGILAGNTADRPACSNSPLLRTSGVTPGWWWHSPTDYFRPRCPIA